MLETTIATARMHAAGESRRAEPCAQQPGVFPWHERSAADWQRLVSPAEAAQLVLLASRQEYATSGSTTTDHQIGPLSPEHLTYWGLSSLPLAFGANVLNPAIVRQEALSVEPPILHQRADLPTLTARLSDILDLTGTAHSAVMPLLLTMRQLRNERMRPPAAGTQMNTEAANATAHNDLCRQQPALGHRSPPTVPSSAHRPLPVAAAQALSLSRAQQADALARYQALVDLFAPQVRFQVYRLPERLVDSRADEEQAVLMRLTDAVVKFYWEPAVLDPTETVKRFILFAHSSTHNPLTESFDTRALEVSVQAAADHAPPFPQWRAE